MKNSIYFLCFILSCLFCGCGTTKYVPTERLVVRTDTVYSAKVRVDSVIYRDSVSVFHKGDTVYVSKYRDRWRTRVLTDTVYQSAVDSVKVRVPYPVERELTKWEKAKMNFGGAALGGLGICVILGVIIWIIKKKRRE